MAHNGLQMLALQVRPQSCEQDAEMPPTTPKFPAILMSEYTIATPSHWPEPVVAGLRRYFNTPLAVEFEGSFGRESQQY